MLAKDFKPDRLSVAKYVAEEFIGKREFDRIGLVVFSGEAFSQCPVTTDHKIVIDFIRNLNVGFLEDGTAIGMGVATAVNRLKESESKSKIVILMTDGENNSGYIDPETAAEVAKEFGVKLYCIGVGSDGKAIGPINRNLRGEYIFGPVDVNIDEDLLKKISTETGGQYFRALDENSLINIYNVIDKLEKTEIESTVFKKYREMFRWFLSVGIGLLFLFLILKHLILKVNP
jgi:Ca-activated chloride channel family protein